MWGNDFIFMDGFETPSGIWTTNPDPSNYITTPWGQGFDGSKAIHKQFYDPITSNEFWFGAHIKPLRYHISNTTAIVTFKANYTYLTTLFPVPNPMYLVAGLSTTGATRVEYLASKQLFASSGYMVGAPHFELDTWNHFMAGAKMLSAIIDGIRYMKFYSWIYKNNELVFSDESAYLVPYNDPITLYSLLQWDSVYINLEYPRSIVQYDNVWVSFNGPKGDLIAYS